MEPISFLRAILTILTHQHIIPQPIMMERASMSRVPTQSTLGPILTQRVKEVEHPLTMHTIPQLFTTQPIRARMDPLVTMRLLIRTRAPKEVLTVEHRRRREHSALPMLEHLPVLGVVLLSAPVPVLALQKVVAVPLVVAQGPVLGVAQQGAGVPARAVRQRHVVVPLPAVRGVLQPVAALPLVAGVPVQVEMDPVPDLAAVVELGAELKGDFREKSAAARPEPEPRLILLWWRRRRVLQLLL